MCANTHTHRTTSTVRLVGMSSFFPEVVVRLDLRAKKFEFYSPGMGSFVTQITSQ